MEVNFVIMCTVVFFSSVLHKINISFYFVLLQDFFMRINSLLGIAVYILHISKKARTALRLTGIAFMSWILSTGF